MKKITALICILISFYSSKSFADLQNSAPQCTKHEIVKEKAVANPNVYYTAASFRVECFDLDEDYIVDVRTRYRKKDEESWNEVILRYDETNGHSHKFLSDPLEAGEVIGPPGEYEYEFRASDKKILDDPFVIHTTSWTQGGDFFFEGGGKRCLGIERNQGVPVPAIVPQVHIQTLDSKEAVVQEGGKIVLRAIVTIDPSQDTSPFYVWCSQKGYLRPNWPFAGNYTFKGDNNEITFIAPQIPSAKETIFVSILLGDNLGHVARSSIGIEVHGKNEQNSLDPPPSFSIEVPPVVKLPIPYLFQERIRLIATDTDEFGNNTSEAITFDIAETVEYDGEEYTSWKKGIRNNKEGAIFWLPYSSGIYS